MKRIKNYYELTSFDGLSELVTGLMSVNPDAVITIITTHNRNKCLAIDNTYFVSIMDLESMRGRKNDYVFVEGDIIFDDYINIIAPTLLYCN